MLVKTYPSFALVFMMGASLYGQAASWSDKFVRERRAAFGPVKSHSTDEARDFLLLQGRPVHHRVGESPVLTEVEPVERPKTAVDLEPVAAPEPKALRVRKPRKPRKRPASDRIPIEALLEKARAAYTAGRLEDALRYYSLVSKAEPGSAEAAERLAAIRREMN